MSFFSKNIWENILVAIYFNKKPKTPTFWLNRTVLQGVFKTLPRSWSHLAEGDLFFWNSGKWVKFFHTQAKQRNWEVGGMATTFFCVCVSLLLWHGSWISTDAGDVGLIYFGKDIPSLKLTSRTSKFMNPKMKFPCEARPILRCEVAVSGRVYIYLYIYIHTHTTCFEIVET